MTKRFVVSVVVALVVIVAVVAVYMHEKSSPSTEAIQTSQAGPALQTGPLTANNCPAAAANYEKQYQADEKASGKTVKSFLAPQTHYNAALKACLVVVGVAYADNTGVSEDVWIVDASTGHPILKWSNASKYFDDAGPANYVDPAKEGVVTYTPAFQAKAQQYMSQ